MEAAHLIVSLIRAFIKQVLESRFRNAVIIDLLFDNLFPGLEFFILDSLESADGRILEIQIINLILHVIARSAGQKEETKDYEVRLRFLKYHLYSPERDLSHYVSYRGASFASRQEYSEIAL